MTRDAQNSLWSRADLVQRAHMPHAGSPPPASALDDILAERHRQQQAEGWTAEHDDTHDRGEMATAARCYLTGDSAWWPWDRNCWKPKTRRQDLVRAGALALAEADRLRRVAARYPRGRIWAAIHDQLTQEAKVTQALLREIIGEIDRLDAAP